MDGVAYMDQNNKSFIHDTIDLDEIRELLGDEIENAAQNTVSEDEFKNEQEGTVVPTEDLQDDISSDFVDEVSLDHNDAEPAEIDEFADREAESIQKKGSSKKKTNVFAELYSMLHDVIYLLAAVTLIFVFVVRLVGVQGDSMLPTLHNRDYLVLESNFLCGDGDLKYGDVVVLNVPHYQHNGEGPIVKRVIATEGQTVDIDFEAGIVYVDGVRLVEDYINAPTLYNWEGELALEYPATVPEGCIFVLGDNRNNSMDSRYAPIGMVDEQYVLGKVLLIVLPGQTTDEAGNAIEPRDWGRMGLVS